MIISEIAAQLTVQSNRIVLMRFKWYLLIHVSNTIYEMNFNLDLAIVNVEKSEKDEIRIFYSNKWQFKKK